MTFEQITFVMTRVKGEEGKPDSYQVNFETIYPQDTPGHIAKLTQETTAIMAAAYILQNLGKKAEENVMGYAQFAAAVAKAQEDGANEKPSTPPAPVATIPSSDG